MLCVGEIKMKQSYYLYKSGRLQRKDNTLEIVYKDNLKIRKVYYDSWNQIINQDIEFEKRVKNPPDNAINSLISYVNTLVYTRVLSEIYKTQLNPTISYLHQPSERRFSLCLDIAEIFKPIIADRLIFSMLNKKQITEKDFEKGLNFLYIKDVARKE